MNNLRLLLAFSSITVFFGCVENEIVRYEVQISVQPQGSASIFPEIYGPLFPGDSLSITFTPVENSLAPVFAVAEKQPMLPKQSSW